MSHFAHRKDNDWSAVNLENSGEFNVLESERSPETRQYTTYCSWYFQTNAFIQLSGFRSLYILGTTIPRTTNLASGTQITNLCTSLFAVIPFLKDLEFNLYCDTCSCEGSSSNQIGEVLVSDNHTPHN